MRPEVARTCAQYLTLNVPLTVPLVHAPLLHARRSVLLAAIHACFARSEGTLAFIHSELNHERLPTPRRPLVLYRGVITACFPPTVRLGASRASADLDRLIGADLNCSMSEGCINETLAPAGHAMGADSHRRT